MDQSRTPRIFEACFLAAGILADGYFAFRSIACGTGLLRLRSSIRPVPLLIWAALRFGFGGMSALDAGHHDSGDLGNDARTRAIPGRKAPVENALALQLFLLMLADSTDVLAVGNR
jgi:hypothetical protein